MFSHNIDSAYPYILTEDDNLYLHINPTLEGKGSVIDTETNKSILP
jgi:hypothetical protein